MPDQSARQIDQPLGDARHPHQLAGQHKQRYGQQGKIVQRLIDLLRQNQYRHLAVEKNLGNCCEPQAKANRHAQAHEHKKHHQHPGDGHSSSAPGCVASGCWFQLNTMISASSAGPTASAM